MRPFLTILSLVAAVAAVASLGISFVTHPPYLPFRLIASVLLLDQATLALLSIRLSALMQGIRPALLAASTLALVAGIGVLVACALPHPGPPEIVMAVVGALLVLHATISLFWLRQAPGTA